MSKPPDHPGITDPIGTRREIPALLDGYKPGSAPAWLGDAAGTIDMRRHYSASAPDKKGIAGPYSPAERWMLENHVADLLQAHASFVIAPMQGGLGTYRI